LDAVTAFIIASCFALLNGAVLGFVHSSLTDDLKPSAVDWRRGTLLIALSGFVFAANGVSGELWLLPIANGLVFVGFALCWRSIRRYTGRRDRAAIFVPALIGFAALLWFTFASPNLPLRVAISTLINLFYCLSMAYALYVYRKRERSIASAFLIGLYIITSFLVVLRVVYYATIGSATTSITATGSIIAALTPLLISALPIAGTTAFALLCFERIRRDLHVAATTDALTGLLNRRTIGERANEMFAQAKLKLGAFSMGVIDVDHFKSINDRYGHEVGDRVLTHIAQALSHITREGSAVGRQGGEEFIVLFDAADREEALKAVERLRQEIAGKPFVQDGQSIDVTVSIGLATRQADDANVEDVLRRADRALYAAKAAGRNCVR
jgi:diguanylate cyclase (GGDEF)-like protein